MLTSPLLSPLWSKMHHIFRQDSSLPGCLLSHTYSISLIHRTFCQLFKLQTQSLNGLNFKRKMFGSGVMHTECVVEFLVERWVTRDFTVSRSGLLTQDLPRLQTNRWLQTSKGRSIKGSLICFMTLSVHMQAQYKITERQRLNKTSHYTS